MQEVFYISMTIKAVVADDDEPICNLVSNLLETFESVVVAGKAGNGDELELPNLDGLSAAQRIQKEYLGLFIVFISTYSECAVEAFNLETTDYLIKPVDRDRIGRSLPKVMRHKESQLSIESKRNNDSNQKRLCLKSGHGIVIINPEK